MHVNNVHSTYFAIRAGLHCWKAIVHLLLEEEKFVLTEEQSCSILLTCLFHVVIMLLNMQQWWPNFVVTTLLSKVKNIVDNVVHAAWPAQLCPYHVGRFNFVHIMLANSRRWELMLCVRQPKEIIYISRFLVIINWNKLDITVQFALNDDAAFEDGGQITFITSTFFVHLFSSIRFTIESHFLT